jgi:tetratricopeptide (TPR) repeat protein
VSAPISMDSDPARDSLTGTVAGRFEIENRVGIGGMGEVYRAHDTRLKCPVALKRLAPALLNDALYRRRFLEEAQRAVRLRNDPRVAAVYDVLEVQNEIFLIMEFVEGETLRQRLARPIQMQEFLHIASQCAEALVAANDRGIIHGDIKPENIMLTPTGQVKILDFGVAKQMLRTDDDATVDPAAMVSGTPAYMAPEILLKKEADGRADIFSLGIVFYESLTGRHPFRADSFSVTSDRIRGEKPTPAHSFNPDVSPALESILQRMLAKKPADRYPTASDLLADLDHLQSGITPARLLRLLPMQQRKAGVRRGFLLGAAAVLGIVLASWGVYAWMHRPPVLPERGWALISDFESTGDDPVPDLGIREGLRFALEQSRYVNVFPRNRTYEALKRMKLPAGTHVDENVGSDMCKREGLKVLLAGSIEHFGNTFQIIVRGIDPYKGKLLFAEREHFNRKEEMIDKVDAISNAVRKDLGESFALIQNSSKPLARVTTPSYEALQLYSQAKDYIDQGKEEQAEAPLKEAIQIDPNFAMAHLQLGLAYATGVGKNESVLSEFQRAYDLREDVSDHEQRWIEAGYYAVRERYEDEVQVLKMLVSFYPDDADAHKALADSFYDIGQVDEAIAELRELTRLNPLSVSAVGTLVSYLADANHPQEAIDTYEKGKQQGLDSPELHRGLGLAYLALDRIDDARKEFHTIESGDGIQPGLGTLYLAKTDMYQGKIGSAIRVLDASIDSDKKRHRKGFQLNSLFFKGRLLLLIHQKKLAQQQAAAMLQEPATDILGSDLQNAGILFARSGRIEDSKRIFHRLESINATSPSRWNQSCLLNVGGEIALAQGKLPAAILAFTSAAAKSPQVTSHVGLARAYAASENWDAAITQWNKVAGARGELLQFEFPPDLAWANLQLARTYRRVGDESLSREHYKVFLKLWGGSDRASFLRDIEREMQGSKPPVVGEEM